MQFKLAPKIAQHFVELKFCRYLAREVDLPADVGTGFEQHDLVATRSGIHRERHPGGARADDRDAPRHRRKTVREVAFAARPGID